MVFLFCMDVYYFHLLSLKSTNFCLDEFLLALMSRVTEEQNNRGYLLLKFLVEKLLANEKLRVLWRVSLENLKCMRIYQKNEQNSINFNFISKVSVEFLNLKFGAVRS